MLNDENSCIVVVARTDRVKRDMGISWPHGAGGRWRGEGDLTNAKSTFGNIV